MTTGAIRSRDSTFVIVDISSDVRRSNYQQVYSIVLPLYRQTYVRSKYVLDIAFRLELK